MAHLIRIYKNGSITQLIGASRTLADVFFCALRNSFAFVDKKKVFAAHEDYRRFFSDADDKTRFFSNGDIRTRLNGECQNSAHLIISNARFITNIERGFLDDILKTFREEVLVVNVTPELLSYRERMRFDSRNEVAGFRRYCSHSIRPAPVPRDWPCHVFIRTDVLDRIPILPAAFVDFVSICRNRSLRIRSLDAGGSLLDLEDESHILQFLTNPDVLKKYAYSNRNRNPARSHVVGRGLLQHKPRLVGEVILADNASVNRDAVVVGPAILCEKVKVLSGSIVKGSIICPDISLRAGCRVINDIIRSSEQLNQPLLPDVARLSSGKLEAACYKSQDSNFRTWPGLSYPGCLKRMDDILISSLVLAVSLPLLALISLIIKFSSPGPVFFKDRRQGRYGTEFDCIKFRTMIVGADRLQDKLRGMNNVDGPQFKVDKDPRVTKVGKVLRDTYIDEIPQFINVLLGQMSLVGPRPSPRKENSLCPFWRDARLSVRPGITGLWQVCGTRLPGRDFQEWIHYDVEYVRNLSFPLDLLICLKTAKKIIMKILNKQENSRH